MNGIWEMHTLLKDDCEITPFLNPASKAIQHMTYITQRNHT